MEHLEKYNKLHEYTLKDLLSGMFKLGYDSRQLQFIFKLLKTPSRAFFFTPDSAHTLKDGGKFVLISEAASHLKSGEQ